MRGRGANGAARAEARAAARAAVRVETRAERWGVAAFVVGAVVTIAIMLVRGERMPLAGAASLGNLAGWIAAACAGIVFALSFIAEMRAGHAEWRRRLPLAKRVVDLVAMSIAMAMLAYLLVLAVANLFQLGFVGLTVDPLGGGALAGGAAAALTYAAAVSGARVTTDGLATLATLVLFIGTMASMLSAPDQSWWQLHFSQLGNSDDASGYRFNLALIVTGLVVTVLANYVGHDLERGLLARGVDPQWRVRTLSWLFAGIGLCLAVAGFVPDAVSFPLHVGAATGMVVVFGVFVFCALRFLPGLPRELAGFSLIVVIGILVAVALWVPIGYFNLTGMEFIAAGLLFAWLLVFVRATNAYAAGDPAAAHEPASAAGAATEPAAEPDA